MEMDAAVHPCRRTRTFFQTDIVYVFYCRLRQWSFKFWCRLTSDRPHLFLSLVSSILFSLYSLKQSLKRLSCCLIFVCIICENTNYLRIHRVYKLRAYSKYWTILRSRTFYIKLCALHPLLKDVLRRMPSYNRGCMDAVRNFRLRALFINLDYALDKHSISCISLIVFSFELIFRRSDLYFITAF